MSLFKKKTAPYPEAQKNPFDDPASIGNILMSLGKITKEQLFSAVGKQAQFNEALLGALLREMGLIDGEDVAKAMVIQKKMRSGQEVSAEMDVLDAKVGELKKGQEELSRVIADRRQRRRDVGEKSDFFLLPSLASAKRS